MNATEGPILVGVDGSTSALGAVRWAAREAATRQVPLHLILAQPAPRRSRFEAAAPIPDAADALLSAGREKLADAEREAMLTTEDISVTSQISAGSPATALIAASEQASALVLGSRGLGGLTALLVGSVAVATAARGHCPVVVVRAGDGPALASRPVVVGVDGTELSDAAVEFAFETAAAHGARLHAVHVRDGAGDGVWPGPTRDRAEAQARRELAEQLGPLRDKYTEVAVRTIVRSDNPGQALIEVSRSAQLVVVGSRGRGALAALALGSVSHALLHHAHGPVAIVRARQEAPQPQS